MTATNPMARLNDTIVACQRCERLRAHCQTVARRKRARFRQEEYFGRPVPNFGDASARLLIVGLAPAAHGANRTGRMFTGDRSGQWLFRALHQTGFANQPDAPQPGDGLELTDAVITAAVHCAPPANRPTAQEMNACAPFLEQTVDLLPDLRVIVCLGRIAFDAVLKLYRLRGWLADRSALRFAHAAEHPFQDVPTILCSYHPSQQNTFTGRLTDRMLKQVFQRAAQIVQAA